MELCSFFSIILSIRESTRQEQLFGMSVKKKSPSDSGSFHRAIRVLDAIALSDESMRFADIEKVLQFPKATLNRLLSQLQEERLVQFDERTQSYTTGFKLMELARQSWDRMDIRRLAHDKLESVSSQTGESVQLAILDGLEMVYVDCVECAQNVRLSVRIGDRIPVYCSGTGKAVLANIPDEQSEKTIRDLRFAAITPNTITSPEELKQELKEIKTRGYAVDQEEHFVGVYCVAAPIVNTNGEPVAAISVGAPNFRVDDSTISRWSVAVTDAAQSIAARLPPDYQ